MRICVPADTRDGANAPVCGHFGSAPWFHVVDLTTGSTDVIANTARHHEHGMCRPIDSLVGQQIDAVVCRAIGPNAARQLHAAGISVHLSDAASVRAVVEQARANGLQPLDPERLCAGGHGHPEH
jgi:predicted Fe-Mo cluster-binding NifX family protein